MMDISPNCDCWSSNDIAITPDIGMAASFDAVALDKACADMVNNAPIMKGSLLDERLKDSCADQECGKKVDKFSHIHPKTNWISGLEYAEKIKLGTMNYELMNI